MTRLYELPLDERQNTACYVDGDDGRWFVAGRKNVAVSGCVAGTREAPAVALPQHSDRVRPTSADGKGVPEQPLRQLWLYTNTDCNLTCRHCLLPEHTTRPPLADLVARLDEAFSLGVTTVFLTGGEPFLRDDLGDLLAHTASRARTVILTNGTLLTPARLAELDGLGAAKWKKNLVFQVSVDGTRHSHDAMRGAGTYDRALAGVRALIDWGRPPTLSTTLTSLTVDAAADVTDLCGQMGLAAHHLFLPHRTGRILGDEDLVPSTAELLEAMRRCRDVAQQIGVVLDNDAALSARVRRPGPRFLSCHGGRDMLAIGPDGVVYPCPSMVGHAEAGSAGAAGIEPALESPQLARFRDHHVERRDDCKSCPVRFFCGGGCAAHSYWTGRSYDAPEPYCEIYRGLIEDRLVAESGRLVDEAGGLGAGEILRPEAAETARSGATARFDCA